MDPLANDYRTRVSAMFLKDGTEYAHETGEDDDVHVLPP
jgi:hypothetical protein